MSLTEGNDLLKKIIKIEIGNNDKTNLFDSDFDGDFDSEKGIYEAIKA